MFNMNDLKDIVEILLYKIDNKYINYYELTCYNDEINIVYHLTNSKTFDLRFHLSYLKLSIECIFKELEQAVAEHINELCIEEVVNERIK